jgi:protoporphyrinogen IX oxidase
MLWFKAFHLIGMVCWFAGLFYLPRLFVYHAMSDDTLSRERFVVMERKLYYFIMWPSLIITALFGLWLLLPGWADYYRSQGWMHAKLFFVLLLVMYHLACGHFVKAFARNDVTQSHRFFRVFNELPVVALIAIVIFVVVKPF